MFQFQLCRRLTWGKTSPKSSSFMHKSLCHLVGQKRWRFITCTPHFCNVRGAYLRGRTIFSIWSSQGCSWKYATLCCSSSAPFPPPLPALVIMSQCCRLQLLCRPHQSVWPRQAHGLHPLQLACFFRKQHLLFVISMKTLQVYCL